MICFTVSLIQLYNSELNSGDYDFFLLPLRSKTIDDHMIWIIHVSEKGNWPMLSYPDKQLGCILFFFSFPSLFIFSVCFPPSQTSNYIKIMFPLSLHCAQIQTHRSSNVAWHLSMEGDYSWMVLIMSDQLLNTKTQNLFLKFILTLLLWCINRCVAL